MAARPQYFRVVTTRTLTCINILCSKLGLDVTAETHLEVRHHLETSHQVNPEHHRQFVSRNQVGLPGEGCVCNGTCAVFMPVVPALMGIQPNG